MLDTEIKVKSCTGELGLGGTTYSHESFGMIRVSRNKNADGVKTFGSEVGSSTTIRFEISNCEVTQDLGSNWYNPRKVITCVELSAVQYAELISNPMGGGSPCTIRNTSELGAIKQKHIETRAEYVESKIQATVTKLHKDVAEMRCKLESILDQNGPIKKDDKQEIRSIFLGVEKQLNDSLPFYEKCLGENIDKMKSEARANINAHIQHTINKTGLAALQELSSVNVLENLKK